MISGLLATLLRWLSGGMLTRVLDHLERRADAETERQRLQTDVAIETIRAEVTARRAAADIVIAEQGWWVTALIRPAFAWPLAIWWGAVIADSLFQFEWNVAALPAPLDEWSGWIIGAYFVTRPFEKVARGYLARGRS
ncbi:MAG TPA: hypothetical protein PLG99_00895 [Kaistiaceae bacterium]|nr:hypothetical protein [Kaistiaceae bacterium]